jgi:tubby and related proteins
MASLAEQKVTTSIPPPTNRRSSRYESDVPINGLSDPSLSTKFVSTTDVPIITTNHTSTSSSIMIMVGAQRRGKGSSLGTGSRGSELDGLVGLPLNVFKYQKNISIPRDRVLNNEYLTAKLNAENETEKTTSNHGNVLRIKVTSPAMVDAFIIVCREVCGHLCSRYEVEQSEQLHLYSAASEIGVPRLQGICEDVIASRFTPKRFVAAVRISLRHGRESMIRLCYFWFKTQGATDYEAFLRRTDMTATEKAVDQAFTTDTVTRSQLFYHRETREISAGGSHRFSIDVFSSTLQTEHMRKSHLFRPPIPQLDDEVNDNKEEKKDGSVEEEEEEGGENKKKKTTVNKDDLIVDRVVEEIAAAEENAKKKAAANSATNSAASEEDKEVGKDEKVNGKNAKDEMSGKSKKMENAEGEMKEDKEKESVKKSDANDESNSASTREENDNINERTESPKIKKQLFKSHDTQIQSALDAKGFKGLKKCHVIRERRAGKFKDQTKFIVLSEPNNEFIVAAIVTDGVLFHFSLDPDDFSGESPDYVGTMDCSFTGTTFTLRDYGMNHDLMNTEVLSEGINSSGIPGIGFVEHCVVVYDTNILGRVPNAMKVHIPHKRITNDAIVDDDLPYHKLEAAENGLLAMVDKSGPDYSRLETRKPIWSDDLEAWTMDFHGRVKLASKKNFLLVSENAPDEVIMLFGKVSKTHFSLDFKAPMTVMQAFCIALTSFADKMLVT